MTTIQRKLIILKRKTIPKDSIGIDLPADLFKGERINSFEPTTVKELKEIINGPALKHPQKIHYRLTF